MKENDIVADIFARIENVLRSQLGGDLGFEQAIVDQVIQRAAQEETAVRRDWNGTRPNVVSQRPRHAQELKEKAIEEVKRTGNVVDAASKNGISRATMYRLLNAGRSKP